MVQTESNETDLDKEIKSLKTKLKVKDEELKKYGSEIDALQTRYDYVTTALH